MSRRPLRPAPPRLRVALLLALPLLLAACGQPAPSAPAALGPTGRDTLRAQTTLTVTSLADSGPGTLRERLAAAAPGDTVTFAVTGAITLLSPLDIAKDVTVQGPGAGALTISGSGPNGTGGDTKGALRVAVGVTFVLRGVTVSGSPSSGLFNEGVTTVENSVFSGNGNGNDPFSYDGAITNMVGATLTVRATTLRDNVSRDGAAITSSGTVLVEDSTISGNTGAAGVLRQIDTGSVTIRNSTLSGNVGTAYGGAIYVAVSPVLIVHSTITANSHGAIVATFGAPVTITHSIVAGNTAEGNSWSGVGLDLGTAGGTFTSGGHNVIGTVTNSNFTPAPSDRTGTDASPLDPRLGALADNGGPTLTHALLPGSPALDLVLPADCTLPADQRGTVRPQGSACDAGAFELFVNTAPAAPVLTGPASPTNANPAVVTWTAASDAQNDPLTYTLQGAHAETATPSTQYSGPALSYGAAFTEGTWTFRVKANDGILDGPWSEPRVVKIDRTPPAAPGVNVSGTPVNGWYKDSATVNFVPGADPVLADRSTGSGTTFTTAPQAFSATGTFSASGVSRDAANNTSAATTVNVSVDASVPAVAFVNCPPRVPLGSTGGATWSASDTGSGLATPGSGSVPLDTATVGPKSVTVTARDKVGHETSAACAYTVAYPFIRIPVKSVIE